MPLPPACGGGPPLPTPGAPFTPPPEIPLPLPAVGVEGSCLAMPLPPPADGVAGSCLGGPAEMPLPPPADGVEGSCLGDCGGFTVELGEGGMPGSERAGEGASFTV